MTGHLVCYGLCPSVKGPRAWIEEGTQPLSPPNPSVTPLSEAGRGVTELDTGLMKGEAARTRETRQPATKQHEREGSHLSSH